MRKVLASAGKDKFYEDCFLLEKMKEEVPYEKIQYVTEDNGHFKFHYLNSKNRSLTATLKLKSGKEVIIKVLATKAQSVIPRQRNFFESFRSCNKVFNLAFLLSLLAIAVVIMMDASNVSSARVPIVIIPLMYLIDEIGILNLVFINLGILAVTCLVSFFSFLEKKEILTFSQFSKQ